MTHIILPVTENNTCNINMEILIGIANGLFIVNQKCKNIFLIKIITENNFLNNS